MYEGNGFIRQLQQGPRHVVAGGDLAVLHHLADAVDGTRVDSGARLDEVAAQAEAHHAGGWIHVEHAGSHLREDEFKREETTKTSWI